MTKDEHKFLFSVIMPIYNVEDYIEEWLESPSAVNKKQTNRETAMLAWEMNNG